MSQTRTAADMGIHPSTLKYRLRILRERYGIQLDDESERMHLLLSFLLFDSV